MPACGPLLWLLRGYRSLSASIANYYFIPNAHLHLLLQSIIQFADIEAPIEFNVVLHTWSYSCRCVHKAHSCGFCSYSAALQWARTNQNPPWCYCKNGIWLYPWTGCSAIVWEEAFLWSWWPLPVCDIYGQIWSVSPNGQWNYQIIIHILTPKYYPFFIKIIVTTYYPIKHL